MNLPLRPYIGLILWVFISNVFIIIFKINFAFIFLISYVNSYFGTGFIIPKQFRSCLLLFPSLITAQSENVICAILLLGIHFFGSLKCVNKVPIAIFCSV